MFHPIVSFFWSALGFAIGGFLVESDNILVIILGWMSVIFALASALYLEKTLILINGMAIFAVTVVFLFGGIFLVNKVLTSLVFTNAVLGRIFPLIVVSAIRFYRTFVIDMLK